MNFLSLECLDQPGHVPYSGYLKQFVEVGKLKQSCPDGYKNLVPDGDYCYSMITDAAVGHQAAGEEFCKRMSNGQLALIDSAELNLAVTWQLFKDDTPAWIGWNWGILFFFIWAIFFTSIFLSDYGKWVSQGKELPNSFKPDLTRNPDKKRCALLHKSGAWSNEYCLQNKRFNSLCMVRKNNTRFSDVAKGSKIFPLGLQ